ncbi:MAG TPA: outer membrane protein assembly factor BamA [Thermoanaerobaculia bacterium]|nr:outer membrane protein assembly factor BamA [Thermoanaerobaculia bacterium]
MARCLLVALALALAASAAPLGAQLAPDSIAPEPAAAAGPILRSIEIRSEVSFAEEEDIDSLLAIEVGRPLADRDVRKTLANLQASGSVAHCAIFERPAADGGVVAVVAIWPAVRVEEVRVEGELGLKREDLRRQLVQLEAQPLSEGAVVRGVFRLQDYLAKEGFLAATVHVGVTYPRPRRASVIYQVTAGPRTLVSTVDFEGNLASFKPDVLREHVRIRAGNPYRAQAIRDDVERLQSWLATQLYGKAVVSPPRAEPAGEGRMRVVFPLDVGPKLAVEVTGASLEKLKKDGLVPFLGEEGYDEALVLTSLGRIKDAYQRQGHYRVKVDHSEERKGDRLAVGLTIVPGPVFTLRRVELTGNRTFSDEKLGGLMAVSARRLLAPGSGRLVESELDQDLKNLRSFYLLEGFAEVRVGPAEVAEHGLELEVEIPIQEGRRELVGELEYHGFEHVDVGKLRRELELSPGGPFHPQRLDHVLERLRAAYAAAGYGGAQVSAEIAWNEAHDKVDVRISALEGPLIVVDRLIVRGNLKTDAEVIRRTIDLKPGDPVSDARLLEVERTLYKLGIFSRVEVSLVRSALEETSRDVLIRVQEGKPVTLTYGFGYDNEDGWRGLLGFNHTNVGGQAYSLRSDLRASQQASRFRLLFDQPYLFKWPVPLVTSLFYEQGQAAQRAFQLTRYGARTELTKGFREKGRLALGLDYRVVKIADLAAGLALSSLERNDRPVQIASLFPSFLWDRRDDPVLPSRGGSSLAQIQYSFPALGADGHFVKLFLQQTELFSLSRSMVLATSLRAGGIEALRDLTAATPESGPLLASRNVFISERFFAGGSTSHRAYGRDELGIRGQTLIQPAGDAKASFTPIGGNGLLLGNAELRFPLAGALGGVVFFDSGNVWADWRSIDLSEVKSGVGVGLRYLSPIGPLRLDLGWKLDRERGEGSGPQFSFTFGNPF